MAGNQVRIGVGVKDNATKPIKGISDAFHRLQTQGGKGFAIGAGAATTAKAFSLLDSAASGVINVLGDAIKAAMADEESVNRLGTSLRANVAAWNGNTAAIEKNILAAQRLGFDDETLRDSLTVLVGATHDVTRAQEIQAIAMDLARFKGVDLRTASEALIKVEGGHYRALAQLGIKLKEGATQTEALAAVQKIAAGQAEAYANTLSGKVAAAQIKFSEQLEDIGKKALPAVADGLESANNLFDNTAKELNAIDRAFKVFGLVLEGDGDKLAAFNAAGGEAGKRMRYMADAAKDDLVPALTDLAVSTADDTDEMKALRAEFNKTRAAANDLTDRLNVLSGILFDQDILAGDIAQAQQDLQDVLKEGPGSKAPGAWTIWIGKVERAKKVLFDLEYQQKQTDGPAAMQAWLLKQRDALDKADVKARAYLDSLIKANAALLALADSSNRVKDDIYVPPTGGGGSTGGTSGGPGPIQLAHGGPISPNEPYLVGEKGPELIVPTSSGRVIPNSSMGGVTVNLTVQGDLRARSKEDVVSALQRAAAFIR